MKRCPECRRDYFDDSLLYCLDDGAALLEGPASASGREEPETAILADTNPASMAATRAQIHTTSMPGLDNVAAAGGSNFPTKLIATVVGVLLLATGGFIGLRYFRSSAKPISSIAVLPFENKSTDADTDYLSDGLTESLIFRLTQLPGLKVSPTSSIVRYKGKETDVAKIAADLGVEAVMTGRLTKRANDLNIAVELVDARNNSSLWGEQYQRKMADLLSTQREIVGTIVQKLQFKLAGNDKAVTKKYTDNNDAYQLYLKGRYYFARRTKEDMYKSIDLYGEAIKIDPMFALAYSAIAESYAGMPSYPYCSPAECVPKAKVAVAKALELDPDLAEAHTNAGGIASTYEWDWPKADAELRRGVELNPDSAVTHWRYAQYLTVVGHHDEAVSEMKRAMELEPMSPIQGSNYAGTLLYARRYNEALDQALKTYELDPNLGAAKFWLGRAYNIKGMYAEALAIDGNTALERANKAYAYAKIGRREKALELLREWHEDEKQMYVMNYWIGIVYAALGDKDAAFAELDKALQNHDWYAPRLKVDPFFDPLRDDPRFDALVKRLNLPQ